MPKPEPEPEQFDLTPGLLEFYSSQAKVMLDQYQYILHLLGKTTNYTQHGTGVLASLVAPLAEARIEVFAVSTFDTDHLFIKGSDFQATVDTLCRSGRTVP